MGKSSREDLFAAGRQQDAARPGLRAACRSTRSAMEAADSNGNASHDSSEASSSSKRARSTSDAKKSPSVSRSAASRKNDCVGRACSNGNGNGIGNLVQSNGQKRPRAQKKPRAGPQSNGRAHDRPPALPALEEGAWGLRPKVRIQDIAPTEEYQYMPDLDDDLALLCLAHVPRSEHRKCMQLNRKFCALFNSGDLFKIRRRHGIAEQWIYMFSSGQLVWQAYDPKARRWNRLPSFEADYCYHNSDKESFTVGTQLLVVGCSADGLVTWRYDLVSNQWARGSMMLTPRCLYAWASCGSYAYVAGGVTLKGEILRFAERYDPETEKWEILPPMHECRKLCSGCLLDGKFYVLGGVNEAFAPLTSAEVYDPATKTWTLLPNMLPWGDSRSFPGAPPLTAVVNNQIYILETESNQLKLYIKSTHSWKALGEVPVRTDLVSGWGVAFKSLGDHLLLIGEARTSDHPDGMYVCRPDLEGGHLQWNFLSRLRPFSRPFVLNCAIVSA